MKEELGTHPTKTQLNFEGNFSLSLECLIHRSAKSLGIPKNMA